MEITKEINKEIFRAYDIRGIADRDLTDDVIYTISRSFATHIRRMGKDTCVIGHDNRLSSERIHKALTRGLIDSGVNILDLELTTTPMYYYACIYEKIDCGIMITASHNPKEDNGLKFAFKDYLNAKGEEITDFYEETIKGDFLEGTGSVKKINVKEGTKEELIKLAAYSEYHSNHPIANSIKTYYNKKIDKKKITDFKEQDGGIKVKIDDEDVLIGNYNYLKKNKIKVEECNDVGTIVYIVKNNKYI